MISLLIGFFILGLVAFGGGQDLNWNTYLQSHSIIIVLGGALGILFVTTPMEVLRTLSRSLVGLLRPDSTLKSHKQEIQSLIEDRFSIKQSKNELVRYAVELWEKGVDEELFEALLSQKTKEINTRSTDAVQAMKNFCKYPPALGMIGTVIGMISLFSNLETQKENIGVYLSLAMTATFLGLVLANMVIAPLADRLQVRQVNQQQVFENMYELLLLINHDEAKALMRDELEERAAS